MYDLVTSKYAPVQLAALRAPQVAEYLQRSDTILIPTGAYEQHGPSCPVGTDTLLAEYFAHEIALKQDLLVGPTLNVGESLLQLDWAGTVALKPTTLILVVKDIITSLYKGGFRRFFFVNAHGDNTGVLFAAMSELGEELTNLRYDVKDFWDFDPFRAIMDEHFGDSIGGHADETDASLLMYLTPALVDSDALASEYIKVRYRVSRDLVQELYSQNGVMNGDQRLATSEVGALLNEAALAGYELEVERFQDKKPYIIEAHSGPRS